MNLKNDLRVLKRYEWNAQISFCVRKKEINGKVVYVSKEAYVEQFTQEEMEQILSFV